MTVAMVPLQREEDPHGRTRFMLPANQLRAALLQDHTLYGPVATHGVPHYELFPLLSALEQAEAEHAAEYHVGQYRSLRRQTAGLLTGTLWRLSESGVGHVFCGVCGGEYPCDRLRVTLHREPHGMEGYESETRLCRCPHGHEVFGGTYPIHLTQRDTRPHRVE